MNPLNADVTALLDALDHPLRAVIENLRVGILAANSGLTENIKWNSPNYSFAGQDRITMRVQPPKQVQLVFHCGAKVQEQPEKPLIPDPFKILTWKTNDRAIASFRNVSDVEKHSAALTGVVQHWLASTSEKGDN